MMKLEVTWGGVCPIGGKCPYAFLASSEDTGEAQMSEIRR